MSGIGGKAFQRLGQEYIEEQNKIIGVQREAIEELRKRCERLESDLEEEKKALYGAQVALSQVYQYMNDRKEMNLLIEENLRGNNRRIEQLENRSEMQEVKIKMALTKKPDVIVGAQQTVQPVRVQEAADDEYSFIDYFDFENHFRGSKESIKEVQKQYLKYFEGRSNVLDLGCGRGEFLELLGENEIKATGVECYPEFAEYCKARGLDVIEDDALTYLEKQEKIGGIFAGQLIEHLKFNQIVRLCELAYEKLEDGAYIIMETPNPMTLAIYTHAFYMDPSHNKPIHPYTMEYFMRKVGFKEVEILFTETSKYPMEIPKLTGENIENIEAFNRSMEEVSRTLFGSQDYAIVGRK